MKIWKQEFTLEGLNYFNENTLAGHLGMVFSAVGDDYLEAYMPIDKRTVQPARILHGGASVALAETLGSVASFLCLDGILTKAAVGLEINASHLKAVPENTHQYVWARCKPIRLGRTIHVWDIQLRNENGDTTCIVRLTMAIIDRKA